MNTPLKLGENGLRHAIKVLINLRIGETNDMIATGFQNTRSLRVLPDFEIR